MRIHTDLSEQQIYKALANLAGVGLTSFSTHRSQKRARAFEIKLFGNSPRRQNRGSDYAATWDEWGIFIQNIFEQDPTAIVGMYESYDMFRTVTADRFLHFTQDEQHRAGHRWEPLGGHKFACKGCDATQDQSPFIRTVQPAHRPVAAPNFDWNKG